MSEYIIKFAENRYCRWSSTSDSPITYLTDTRNEAIEKFGLRDVEIADRIGCSCCDNCSENYIGPSHVDQLLNSNAAGINEEHIGLDEILKVWSKPK